MSRLARTTLALAVAAALLPVAAASAAPPPNDERTSPAVLGSLPAQVAGTTVEATRAMTDPFSSCAASGPQVWYRFAAPAAGRISVRLQADGDLDATIDAYLSERSQTRNLTCDLTDARGVGAIDFTVAKDMVYLIAVSQLPNSVAGTFTLTVVAPQAAPQPPGPQLAAGGADGTLDRVGNIEDAYSLVMRPGRTYRFRLSGRGEEDCSVRAEVHEPGIDVFDGRPVKSLGCDEDGYATFTPGPREGGRYSVLVSAARGVRTLQRYHLESAGAGNDDTAPGRFLANRTAADDALNGARIDALDLYRFSVARRSDLALTLATSDENAFDLLVLNERGSRVECACGDEGDLELSREIAPGRYFVAVRARDRSAGSYRLLRTSRLLTRTSAGIDRRARLGRTARIGVRVRPAVSGPVTVEIQRFDPLAGWLFFRQERTRSSSGRASVGFVAPRVGRWRVRATFDGTIGAGRSVSGFDELLVSSPPPPS